MPLFCFYPTLPSNVTGFGCSGAETGSVCYVYFTQFAPQSCSPALAANLTVGGVPFCTALASCINLSNPLTSQDCRVAPSSTEDKYYILNKILNL